GLPGVDDLAVGTDSVPDRDGDAEEPLARDQPVAVEAVDPVLEADLHVGRVPAQLLGPAEQRVAQVAVAPAVGDVPLPSGDDLEGPVALLVELDRVGDGPGLAVEIAAVAEQ